MSLISYIAIGFGGALGAVIRVMGLLVEKQLYLSSIIYA